MPLLGELTYSLDELTTPLIRELILQGPDQLKEYNKSTYMRIWDGIWNPERPLEEQQHLMDRLYLMPTTVYDREQKKIVETNAHDKMSVIAENMLEFILLNDPNAFDGISPEDPEISGTTKKLALCV